MAKRKYSRKQSKIQPANLTFTLATPSVGQGLTQRFYLDLSQVASIVNRRFYRQGLNWAVAGIKVTSVVDGAIIVGKIPNSWVASNAWRKAFESWRKQQDEALAEGGSESMKAAFNDFKVFMEPAHVTAGFATNLLPIDMNGNTATAGTWEPSQIVLPNVNADASGSTVDPAERFLHMLGTNTFGALSRGILEGYADSRAYPQSPDPVGPDMGDTQNWMARMFDVGNDMEEVLDNATLRNDTLPYPQVDYPGGQGQLPGPEWHDFAQIYATSATTNVGVTRLKGGNFPCGLIAIDWTPIGDTANLVMQIDLIPGNHRGYMAESMLEM